MISAGTETNVRCHVCGDSHLSLISGWEAFQQVTSDCRPWPREARLAICQACGVVQKVIDETWHTDCAAIYNGYAIYSQSGGSEQPVFDSNSGAPSPRSARLMEALSQNCSLPARGRLLDVGCGNGAFLKIASEYLPDWTLAGTEVSGKYQAMVQAIPGVEALFTCALDLVPGAFDVITLVHVLEHIPSPIVFLTMILGKLHPNGILFVEVPNHLENPFELLIADHASHFSRRSLAEVISRSGFDVTFQSDSWVKKELTVIAMKSPEMKTADSPSPKFDAKNVVGLRNWLAGTVAEARAAAGDRSFGLFGTSIAATWLFHELKSLVDFFVDEDPLRSGMSHLGKRIYRPGEAPAGSHLFIALPTPLAREIATRLQPLPLRLHLPPPMEPAEN